MILEMTLADAGLSVRTVNTLEEESIFTVADLSSKTRDELMSIQNFGDKTLAECNELMKKLKIKHPSWARRPRSFSKKKS
ncbi:MAG: hypothetical protein KDA84_15980 [Planctomycetaceae bacterium]|nr:hypothetical protein [Planctomycetaceae bacterium]